MPGFGTRAAGAGAAAGTRCAGARRAAGAAGTRHAGRAAGRVRVVARARGAGAAHAGGAAGAERVVAWTRAGRARAGSRPRRGVGCRGLRGGGRCAAGACAAAGCGAAGAGASGAAGTSARGARWARLGGSGGVGDRRRRCGGVGDGRRRGGCWGGRRLLASGLLGGSLAVGLPVHRRRLPSRPRGAAAGMASRSLRTTGGSTVDDADRTNSPISVSLAMTTLLSTPSSLASS